MLVGSLQPGREYYAASKHELEGDGTFSSYEDYANRESPRPMWGRF